MVEPMEYLALSAPVSPWVDAALALLTGKPERDGAGHAVADVLRRIGFHDHWSGIATGGLLAAHLPLPEDDDERQHLRQTLVCGIGRMPRDAEVEYICTAAINRLSQYRPPEPILDIVIDAELAALLGNTVATFKHPGWEDVAIALFCGPHGKDADLGFSINRIKLLGESSGRVMGSVLAASLPLTLPDRRHGLISALLFAIRMWGANDDLREAYARAVANQNAEQDLVDAYRTLDDGDDSKTIVASVLRRCDVEFSLDE